MSFTEKYKELIKTIASDGCLATEDVQDYVDFLDNSVEKFAAYLQAAVAHDVGVQSARIMIAGGRMDIEDFRYRVTTLDRERKSAHDVAIDSCAQLNRICSRYNLEPICPVTGDRHVIADFVAQTVYEIYLTEENRRVYSLENMAEAIGGGDEPKFDAVIQMLEDEAEITQTPASRTAGWER